MTDVARAAGVSPMTVSYTYNRPERVSAASRDKVLRTAAALGYPGPDPSARSLRYGATRTLGVVLGEHLTYAFDDPQAVLFLAGIAEVCAERGYGLLIVPTGTGDEDRDHAVAVVVARAGGHDEQSVPAFGAQLGDAGEEEHGLRVVEGIGEVLAEHDAEGAGGAVPQGTRAGIRPGVPERRGGLPHRGPGLGGDPLRPVVRIRHRHRRHTGRACHVGHRHPAGGGLAGLHPAIVSV